MMLLPQPASRSCGAGQINASNYQKPVLQSGDKSETENQSAAPVIESKWCRKIGTPNSCKIATQQS